MTKENERQQQVRYVEPIRRKDDDDKIGRAWVIAIALLCLLLGSYAGQMMNAITIGQLVNNPNWGNPNGNTTTTTNMTTTTTTMVSTATFQILVDPVSGNTYKKGYYQSQGQYSIHFFEIRIKETSGSGGTVTIRCAINDKSGFTYQQDYQEPFNAYQEKTLEFFILIETSVWQNDQIVWSTSSVVIL